MSRALDNEKNLSPDRNGTYDLPRTKKLHTKKLEPGHILGPCMTCVLLIAWISNVETADFPFVHK